MDEDERARRLWEFKLSKGFDALAKARGVEFLLIRLKGGEVLTWDEGVFMASGRGWAELSRRLDLEEIREELRAEGIELDDDLDEGPRRGVVWPHIETAAGATLATPPGPEHRS